MARYLITGASGFLGSNLVRLLETNNTVFGTDLIEPETNGQSENFIKGDLTDMSSIKIVMERSRPEIVINTVAIPDLDLCENNTQLAHQINVVTASNTAKVAAEKGIRMLHISTDQLFRGEKSFYDESDPVDPCNNYGVTKALAEKLVIKSHKNSVVIRTNFFGLSSGKHSPTFAEWLYSSLRDEKPINLFHDYYFTPIEVTCLVEYVEKVAKSDYCGILHVAGGERCSKYDFGYTMAQVFGFAMKNVQRCSIDEFPLTVQRQKDLSLSTVFCSKLLSLKMPDVREGLQRFKENMDKKATIGEKTGGQF